MSFRAIRAAIINMVACLAVLSAGTLVSFLAFLQNVEEWGPLWFLAPVWYGF